MKATKSTRQKDVNRSWHKIDVGEKILGRQATKIAQLLIGKDKPYYTPNIDCGDHVVVVNAKNVQLSGKKETDKVYTRYSGYPGGLKKITVEQMRNNKPEEIITRAVSGMLPKNKLRKKMLTRLHVFEGEQTEYTDKVN